MLLQTGCHESQNLAPRLGALEPGGINFLLKERVIHYALFFSSSVVLGGPGD